MGEFSVNRVAFGFFTNTSRNGKHPYIKQSGLRNYNKNFGNYLISVCIYHDNFT